MPDASDLIDRARRTSVVVVGGGVAGLVAAFEFAKVGMSVTVLERSDRWGGALAAADLGGIPVDPVVDAFDPDSPALRTLLHELDLSTSVEPVAPAPPRIGTVTLPAENLLGIPANPWDPAVRRVVGWRGVWRAYLDRLRPPLTIGHQRNLGALVRGRMGERVCARMVAPVTRATLGLDPDEVDVERVAPALLTALTRTGSLAGAVAELTGRPSPRSRLSGGTHRLPAALVDRLSLLGADLRTERAAQTVREADGALVVETDAEDGAEPLTADIVVVATGPHDARGLLADAITLPEAPTVSVDIVLLRTSAAVAGAALDAHTLESGVARRVTGVVPPAAEGSAAGQGTVRVLSDGDPAATDDERVERAREAVSAVLGMPVAAAEVTASACVRLEWPVVADLDADAREAGIAAALAATPGLAVVGRWASGGGLAETVAHAVESADRLRRAALWAPQGDRDGSDL